MKKTLIAGVAALAAILPGVAVAEYPEKPVEFVVPWPPGDAEDVLTRMIAEDFQEKYGVPAAVVNKPGGGGGPFPGAIEVANAPADGYTIGSFVIGVPVIGHLIDIPDLAPEKFDPLGIFLTYPFVLAASGDAPYSNMAELAEYAKTNDVALGHFGAPLPPTKVSLGYAKASGFEWGSEAAFDALDCNTLASGDADVINTTLQLVLPCLDKITVLASVTDERIASLPTVPTMGELVPALQVFDAVSQGTAEMGHSGAYYWKGKIPASPFFSTVPFGLTGAELNGWFYHGGGLDVYHEAYAPFGVIPYPIGNSHFVHVPYNTYKTSDGFMFSFWHFKNLKGKLS